MAYYENLKGEKVALESTKTTECPVSLIKPDIEWLHGQFLSNKLAVRSGGTLYGPDTRKWPAYWADVVNVCNMASREANGIIGIDE